MSDHSDEESSNTTLNEEDLNHALSHLQLGRTFRYKPLLKKSAFRVLELLPGQFDDVIRVRLQEANWDSPPPYEAISYAWGDAMDTLDCECEGEKFRITRSLHLALQHFRRQDVSRFLWADAVCIDQSDKPELGHQVKNMRSIYEKADRTLIWLGADESGHGQIAVEVMKRISPIMLQTLGLTKIDWKTFPPKPLSHILKDTELVAAMNDLTQAEWVALKWVYTREWFTRLWVIQEYHSSPDALTMIGPNEIETNTVILVADWLTNLPPHMRNEVQLTKRKTFIQACCTMSYPRFQVIYNSSFASVLHEAENYQSSDPRDRVYAMLYLPHLADMWKSQSIDYKMPIKEVYKSVVEVSLDKEEDLTILNYIRPRHLATPTWIPRWDKRPHSPPLLQYRSGFRATHGQLASPPGIIEGDNLFVRGVDVGRVIKMSGYRFYRALGYGNVTLAPSGGPATTQRTPEARALAWKELLQPTSRYQSQEEIVDTYCRVLGVVDREKMRDGLPERMVRFVATMCEDHLPVYRTSSDGAQERVTTLTQSECQGITSRVTNLTRDRVVFTTENGYIGLGPHKMRYGDRLVLLFGATTPFILRPRKGGHYKIVGECYVHDMMWGEYFSSGDHDSNAEKQFELH